MDYMAKDGEVISNLPDGFDDKLCVNIKDEDRKARDAWPEMIKYRKLFEEHDLTYVTYKEVSEGSGGGPGSRSHG